MNAVRVLAHALPADLVGERLEREGQRAPRGDEARARRLAARWELDLCGFLNGAGTGELTSLCRAFGLPCGRPGAMRQRLWSYGARLERAGVLGDVESRVQPAPVLSGARLALRTVRSTRAGRVLPAARAARFPASPSWPRPIPPQREVPPSVLEPPDLESLLAHADALVGVRLGVRDRDKGFYGNRIADLLGLPRSSEAAPDWRGEVEVKTLAFVRDSGARWRLKDTPALSMSAVDARAKLARVLWMLRVDEGDHVGTPVLSWFYQELDADLSEAFESARHLRPKGGKGTEAKGWYLSRSFFVACGLMRSLNGE